MAIVDSRKAAAEAVDNIRSYEGGYGHDYENRQNIAKATELVQGAKDARVRTDKQAADVAKSYDEVQSIKNL